MGVPKQVYQFAKNFVASNSSLNILMNNAGCMINERTMVEDGQLEANFAANTLGTYILTKTLMPLIEKSDKPRIVTKMQLSKKETFPNLFFNSEFLSSSLCHLVECLM